MHVPLLNSYCNKYLFLGMYLDCKMKMADKTDQHHQVLNSSNIDIKYTSNLVGGNKSQKVMNQNIKKYMDKMGSLSSGRRVSHSQL